MRLPVLLISCCRLPRHTGRRTLVCL
jgi:hypothetical protein